MSKLIQENIDSVIKDNDKVLLYFTASWCGPCKATAPIIESAAQKTELPVAKVDVEEHQGLVKTHKVKAVPTFLLLEKEKEVSRLTGAQSEDSILSLF